MNKKMFFIKLLIIYYVLTWHLFCSNCITYCFSEDLVANQVNLLEMDAIWNISPTHTSASPNWHEFVLLCI